MIEIKDLCFSRRDGNNHHQIFEQLNISIPANQQVALLGDSGTGKTTFLHLLAGLLRAENGSIEMINNIFLKSMART